MEIIKHIILLEQFVGSIKPKTKGSWSILISTGSVACGVYKFHQQTQTQTRFVVSDLHRLGGAHHNQHRVYSLQNLQHQQKKKTKLLSLYIPSVMPGDLTNSPKYILR